MGPWAAGQRVARRPRSGIPRRLPRLVHRGQGNAGEGPGASRPDGGVCTLSGHEMPDRGTDGLRKAKYLVRYRPVYFSTIAVARLDHFRVGCTSPTSFAFASVRNRAPMTSALPAGLLRPRGPSASNDSPRGRVRQAAPRKRHLPAHHIVPLGGSRAPDRVASPLGSFGKRHGHGQPPDAPGDGACRVRPARCQHPRSTNFTPAATVCWP